MKKVVLGKTGIISVQNACGALPIQRVSDEYAVKLLHRAYAVLRIEYDDTGSGNVGEAVESSLAGIAAGGDEDDGGASG